MLLGVAQRKRAAPLRADCDRMGAPGRLWLDIVCSLYRSGDSRMMRRGRCARCPGLPRLRPTADYVRRCGLMRPAASVDTVMVSTIVGNRRQSEALAVGEERATPHITSSRRYAGTWP